jgi:serine-type D-Ala-D-Ala carboxypeptidase/endopeptidase (penicillin-binding protein 4)
MHTGAIAAVTARALPLVLLLVAACARTGGVPLPEPRPFDFARMADSIVATPPLHRAHLGIIVYDPAARRVLYEHNADRRFVPASNQKYWPTATALHELGADFRYRTPVIGLGFDEASGTAQALLVIGRGDPTWSARFHDADHAALASLADSIAGAGVRHVAGDLIIDGSYFDAAIIPGTWTYGNLNGASAPPTAAFAVAEGLFRLRIAPGPAPGTAAAVEVAAPSGVVPLLSAVTTAPAGTPGATFIRRGPWDDTLRVGGAIRLDAEPQLLRVPMTDPLRFAGHVLADALRSRGITIAGDVRIVLDTADAAALHAGHTVPGAAPLPVREIAALTSPDMADVVAAILAPSQNWMAEQLVRTLGAERAGEGSWRAGIGVQNAFLFGPVGIDSAALRLNDGSGMSHQNLVTPRAVVQLLDHARTAAWGPLFRAGLAKPAEPGTLNNRLRHLEGRLAGKTGTLANVNALSGYVTTRDGRELIFVILSNASGLPAAPVVAAIDALVTALTQ